MQQLFQKCTQMAKFQFFFESVLFLFFENFHEFFDFLQIFQEFSYF